MRYQEVIETTFNAKQRRIGAQKKHADSQMQAAAAQLKATLHALQHFLHHHTAATNIRSPIHFNYYGQQK